SKQSTIETPRPRTSTPPVPQSPDLVFVDTETTGFSPYSDEVIEIAAIRVDGALEELDRFQSYLIPHGTVRATHIHGLTRDFLLANGRPQEEVYCEFAEFLGDNLIAGHNVNYDLGMLQANGIRNNVKLNLRIGYDTLPNARSNLQLPSYKLGRIVTALNLGDGQLRCHNALDDVLATIELAKHLRWKSRRP
ncbi:MAG: 3'-5' exonuclease, partial [Candidatus Omnitrophica bacterium]|nr:3'-5' exonuclease [Candidatus Omnitrophota bacterium]